MKFKIITLGCKVNTYESICMKEKLIDNNFIETFDDDADIVIINTCSVTNMADAKSRKVIRAAKKENKNAIIVVCGCSAENHREDLLELGIDILIGNNEKSNIVDLINDYVKSNNKYIKFYDNKNLSFEDMVVSKFKEQTRAYIKIQDGCNNYCTYCIIPFLRGNLRSKDFDKVIDEAKLLVKNNHKEIVLTGIHTGSYGTGTNYDLVDLLNELVKIDGLERIRLSSIEITELNDKFLKFLKDNPKLCDHLHIPLQAGSDHVLKLMHRKYDINYFIDKINTIRSIRPNISITTDVIVGFPEETDEDFNNCLEVCKLINFSKIHVFPYSKRDGTLAAKMKQVNDSIKKDRTKKLLSLSEELEKKYYQNYLNKEVEVLIEEIKDNKSIGHTFNYLKVIIDDIYDRNNLVKVKIYKIDNLDIYAK